nr:helix-turn-helix domain-containing protein [Pontibaca salina]
MLSISTDVLEARFRTDFWRALSSPLHDVSPTVTGEVLEGGLDARMLGSLMVGKRHSNARRNLRDRARITQGEMDGYQLELFLDGSLVGDCDGTDMRLGPGDIGIFDYARPYRTQQTAGTSLLLYMSRDRLDAAMGGQSAHGAVLRAEEPITLLISNIIQNLVKVMPDISDKDAMAVDTATIDLIAAGIARQRTGGEDKSLEIQRVQQREILAFIRLNLADPELGPDMLAHRFRMSRTHLYRIFASQGGIASLIRQERLRHAFRELQRNRNRTITMIAYDYGFSSSHQFLRAFRAQYGMTPSDARQRSGSTDTCRGVAGLAAHLARTVDTPPGA